MSKRDNYEARTEELLLPIVEKFGVEIYDVEYVKEGSSWFLRVFVDKEGGIDIDDCGLVSEYLSEQLDNNDPIPDAYFLEVSSPGAERPLKKTQDYVRAIGKHVYVTTYEPINGLKEFEGTLISYDEETLVIKVGKKEHSLPFNKVASARLAIVF